MPRRKEITMRFLTVALISILLSGCQLMPKTIVVGGVEDYIRVPKGAKVCNVSLPTDEPDKKYCVVTSKDMQLVSMDAWNRIEKGQ
jgi:hypothetical protein